VQIAVFGATGRVGSQILAQAVEASMTVRAFVRPASAASLSAGVEVVRAELTDDEAIARCVEGVDAVLSALGPRSNTADQPPLFASAVERITARMSDAGVRRFVAISGAGTLLEDERPDFGRRVVRGVMKVVARHVLECKRREADVILATELDWVIVRPPRIVDGAPTGRSQPSLDRPRSTKVTTGDVAEFMLRCAREDEWVREAPFIAGP